MHIPTEREALMLSAVALLSTADTLEAAGKDSISVVELRSQARGQLVYLSELDEAE